MEMKEGMLVRHVTGGPVMVVESIALVGVAKINGYGEQMTRVILPASTLRPLTETEVFDYLNAQLSEAATDGED